MPMKPEIHPQKLLEELKKFNIFQENKLKSSTDPVGDRIKKSLNLKMKSLSIYLHVSQDRYDCKTNLEKHFKITPQQEEKNFKRKRDEDYNPLGPLSNPHNCDVLKFKVTLPLNEIVNSRQDNKKQMGWTNNFDNALWAAQPLPCAFNYHTGYLTKTHFKVCATCTKCKTDLKGIGEIEEVGEKIVISIETFDTSEIEHHNKKRKLAYGDRVAVGKKAVKEGPAGWRKKQLNKPNYRRKGFESAHVNTTVIVQKAKDEYLNKALKFTLFKGKSINNKAYIDLCSIRALSLKKFYVYYWTKDQIDFWNQVRDLDPHVSFDATGGLTRRYSFYPDDKSSTLLYYNAVVGFEKKIIPIFQAILSIHDVGIIKDLFDEWLKSGAKKPKEIRTDGALAMQHGINMSLNGCTYNEYNLQCFRIIKGEQHKTLSCWYRHDIVHFIFAIKDWPCMKGDDNIASFYLRCIGYLSQIEDLQQFEEVLSAIVIVAYSTIIDSTCEEKMNFLVDLIKTYEYDFKESNSETDQDDKTVLDEQQADLSARSKDELVTYIDRLFDNAKQKSNKTKEISGKV